MPQSSLLVNKKKTHLSFSGHETFVCRYSWLKKACDAVAVNPLIFRDESAIATFGVGKNMVSSISHWAKSFRIIKDTSEGFILSDLGKSIFADDGWDPYLEDQGTLWLLHWCLTSNIELATTFYYAFNKLNSIEFTKEQLISEILTFAEDHSMKVSPNTIARDIDIFIRTYVDAHHSKKIPIEDSLDCPLVELDLISECSLRGVYRFLRSEKLNLPIEIFVYALLDFHEHYFPDSNVLAFEDIVYKAGSPGLIFKIDEDALAYKLSRLEEITEGALKFDETSSLRQLYKLRNLDKNSFLSSYYS